MKKLVTTLGILILVAVLAAPVFANRWGNGGWGRGPGSCWQGSEPNGNLTENQNAELNRVEQTRTKVLQRHSQAQRRNLGQIRGTQQLAEFS